MVFIGGLDDSDGAENVSCRCQRSIIGLVVPQTQRSVSCCKFVCGDCDADAHSDARFTVAPIILPITLLISFLMRALRRLGVSPFARSYNDTRDIKARAQPDPNPEAYQLTRIWNIHAL